MIKVGVIGHKQVPSYDGGIEAVLTEMLPVIDQENFKITLYNRWTTFYKPSEWFKKENYQGCKIIRIPTFKNSFLNALVYSILASIHAMFCSYDIVHYHAEGPSAMSFLPKLTRKKIVVTNHGLDWARGKWGGFASKYLKFGEKMSAKTADALIVLSDTILQYFSTEYGKEAVKIENGINTKEPKPADIIVDKFGLETNSYFLALGRIVEEKGFHYLIEAYKNLDTDIKLVIAGAITSSEYCQQLIAASRDCPNIIFADFADGDTKRELFSNCFAYIIPSDLEGMSISLLEALGYGCKVIASDIDDNRNICDDKISFFAHGNAESLFNVMKTVNPLSAEEKKEQMKFIQDNYNWKNIAKKTENVYKKVVQK